VSTILYFSQFTNQQNFQRIEWNGGCIRFSHRMPRH